MKGYSEHEKMILLKLIEDFGYRASVTDYYAKELKGNHLKEIFNKMKFW